MFRWLLFALLVSSPLLAARKCKKTERRVRANTAVLGGPALGFETIYVTKKTDCHPILRTTDDGLFVLLQLPIGRVGWVPTGLVDARLSEDKKAKATTVEASKMIALRDTPMRKRPRFDAPVLATLPEGKTVTITGKSPDGLWSYGKGKGGAGWIPRYQLAASAIDKGATPDAGDGDWSVRDADRTTTMHAPIAPKKAAAELPPVRMLGRGQDASIFVHPVTAWNQRYRSDAQNDPYARYDVSSIGGGLGGQYTYRGDLPLVASVFGGFDVWGFNAFAVGEAQAQNIGVLAVDAGGRVGYPALRAAEVDIDLGIGAGSNIFLVGDLVVGGIAQGAFSPGIYFDMHPYVAVRARVARGHAGLLTLSASMPLGGLWLVNDPGGNVDPAKPVQDLPGTFDDPAVPPVCPNPAETRCQQPGPVVNISVGVDVDMRYQYPITDAIFVDVGGYAKLRQTSIGGNGKRAFGVYTEANNIDTVLGTVLGMSFSF